MEETLKKESYEIFKCVFGNGMTEERFYHKHFDNPLSLIHPVRIHIEDGHPAGMNAFMKMKLVEHTQGTQLFHDVSQSNDTAVIPAYRGKHIFTRLITDQELQDTETEYIIGIPNANSYPGFIKMGWRQVCEFTHYILIGNPVRLLMGNHPISKKSGRLYRSIFLRKILSACLDENEDVEICSQIHLRQSEWDEINHKFEAGFVRSDRYMDWKLAGNKNRPLCMILRKEGKLEGYLVYHFTKKGKGTAAVIDDFYAASDGKEHRILQKMWRELLKKADMIDNPFVNGKSMDSELLKSSGMTDFKKIKRNYKTQRLLVSPRGCNAGYLSKLQMRYLDFDIFLNG